jgi:hypothetical protein
MFDKIFKDKFSLLNAIIKPEQNELIVLFLEEN